MSDPVQSKERIAELIADHQMSYEQRDCKCETSDETSCKCCRGLCVCHFDFDTVAALKQIERLQAALRGIQSCSTCERCRGAATLALGEPPGIPAHLEMLAKGAAPEPAAAPAMDTSNTPAEDTQQKVVSAVHYHAREIARLTETWPAPPHLGSASFTAYDIDLFDAGSGVAARMRPEQNGRYYLRSDVDAARAAQPPAAESALRNCLLMAMRQLHVKHPDSLGYKNWEHIVRFCKEGGVEPSPLRAAQPPGDGG